MTLSARNQIKPFGFYDNISFPAEGRNSRLLWTESKNVGALKMAGKVYTGQV